MEEYRLEIVPTAAVTNTFADAISRLDVDPTNTTYKYFLQDEKKITTMTVNEYSPCIHC